jgi:WD40 repeat protein
MSAQRKRERQVHPMPQRELLDELTWQELRGVLDAEIAKLPEKYQAPLVLCSLEGKSQEQAAKELGWPKNTLTKRMGRARELLRQRLAQRGVALSAGVLATVLCEKVSGAEVGAMLTIKTVKAAASIAAGKVVAGGCLSVQAVALTEEVVTGLVGVKAKALVMILAVGLAVSGAGLAGYSSFGHNPLREHEAVATHTPLAWVQAAGQDKKDLPALTDLYGDPLPEGAVGRLGTIRFRHDAWEVKDIAFAPDGKVLASAGLIGVGVCLWDAATGRPLHRLSGSGTCWSVAFSPDAKTLFAAGQDGLLFIDVATGKELRRIIESPGRFLHVAYSPNGQMVAAGDRIQGGSKVVVWDVATGKELHRIEWKYDETINYGFSPSIAFSPNSRILASVSFDTMVRLWDLAAGKEVQRLKGHEKHVWSVAFAPDGKVLASAGDDDYICLWDVETGKLVQRLKTTDTFMPSLAYSPDGKLLASGGRDGCCLWDLATGKELRRWPTPAVKVAFSPDGKVLATVYGIDLRMWDIATGHELHPVPGHTSKLNSLQFAADGKTLFSLGFDRKVFQWDLTTARAGNQLSSGPLWTSERFSMVTAADLSSDGKIAALAAFLGPKEEKVDPVVYLVDTKTGKELHALSGHDQVRSLKFSPNAKLLAIHDKNALCLWDVATGKELFRLKEQPLVPFAPLAFSPDSAQLAYYGNDGTMRLWEIATKKELRRWNSGQQRSKVLCFSPDGKFIANNTSNAANGIANGGVCIWDCATGKELLQFGGMPREGCVVFSASGRTIIVSGYQIRKNAVGETEFGGEIHVLEVLSGQEIRRIDNPQINVESLSLSPDGRTLASGGSDSTILLWDLTGQAINPKTKPAQLTEAQLGTLWSDLAGDAPQADRALWSLALAPAQSLTFLKVQLQPRPPARADQVSKLIADLENERFAVRQKAAQALDALGELAEGILRKTLEGNVTLETRQRVEQILQNRVKDVLRQLRAIDALEQIGTSEAREVLLSLANGTPNPRVADAANAALQRVEKRSQ